eukprot:63220-Hanusia_phi.AAC.2
MGAVTICPDAPMTTNGPRVGAGGSSEASTVLTSCFQIDWLAPQFQGDSGAYAAPVCHQHAQVCVLIPFLGCNPVNFNPCGFNFNFNYSSEMKRKPKTRAPRVWMSACQCFMTASLGSLAKLACEPSDSRCCIHCEPLRHRSRSRPQALPSFLSLADRRRRGHWTRRGPDADQGDGGGERANRADLILVTAHCAHRRAESHACGRSVCILGLEQAFDLVVHVSVLAAPCLSPLWAYAFNLLDLGSSSQSSSSPSVFITYRLFASSFVMPSNPFHADHFA